MALSRTRCAARCVAALDGLRVLELLLDEVGGRLAVQALELALHQLGAHLVGPGHGAADALQLAHELDGNVEQAIRRIALGRREKSSKY